MDFKNIPNKYRPVPFWSWNEKLDVNETKEQIQRMADVGLGGFFMHARGGLQTEYLGEEWFENVKVSNDTAKQLGMFPWAYDENGWPSGFGAGAVNGLGIKYQQKYLRFEKEKVHTDTSIAQIGDLHFYYDVNPFYVDTLDGEVIKTFIDVAYKPYYDRYKNEFEGFFTDEPQISRDGIPWSFILVDEYKERYGEDLTKCLDALFFPVENHEQVRIKFWKMITDLFSKNYTKQIYDWCDERGLKLTGHLVLEESLLCQITSNGACMPHYEYFHIPGMDWLGRNIRDVLTHHQVSSVAQQLGKEQVLSETFALCGHNVSFSELKGIYEWQMVHGINLLCQHLEGYSNRGIRKRDYPPAMYIQQPWWSEYKQFVDGMSREGYALAKGKADPEVLIIHPQTYAWTMFDNDENRGINELNQKFLSVINSLEEKHVLFHLGDESIIERHGKVEGNLFVIGCKKYKKVIVLNDKYLFDNTKKLLEEFRSCGGVILENDAEIPENKVTDCKSLTYTLRECDGYKLHYFVNTSNKEITANIFVKGEKLDIYSGELVSFSKEYEFEPWGSLMIIENGNDRRCDKQSETIILPEGNFEIAGKVKNALTLDFCDYYFDGVLQEENGYVLNIAQRANDLQKKVYIMQRYTFTADYIPQDLSLVCETPEIFKILVNNNEVKYSKGYFRDKSFKTIEIAEFVNIGENEIIFECDFEQSKGVYENIEKSKIFESEKNKLCYDMEIEAIYLVGDFSVKTDGVFEALDKNAVRYKGNFVISEPAKEITLKNVEQQGFPFFSDTITVKGTINAEGENPVLKIAQKGINAVKITINGITKTYITDEKISLSSFNVKSGVTPIEMTLTNNLRNLLGPHHLKEGESFSVGPAQFYKEKCIWNYGCKNPSEMWNDDYCFVNLSLL